MKHGKGRVRDQEQRGRRRVAEWIRAYKARPCLDCGVQYPPYVMQLDHRPGTPKLQDPCKCKTYTSFAREAQHCDVVCANCHAARTWTRRALHSDPSGRLTGNRPRSSREPLLPFD